MANFNPKLSGIYPRNKWDVQNDLSDWLDWETCTEWLHRPDLVYWQLQYCLFNQNEVS